MTRGIISVLILSRFFNYFLGSTVELNTNALKTGIIAYQNALKNGYTKNNLYVVIDFTKPSTQKRFYIIDSSTKQVIYSIYVAHGAGSGSGAYTTAFSNKDGSHATSIGVQRIKEHYAGKHGPNFRIEGLEKGVNDAAYPRFIEIHGAAYIGDGKTGHSWGCYAVPTSEIQYILKTLSPGVIVVSYGNDSNWLKTSKFLSP